MAVREFDGDAGAGVAAVGGDLRQAVGTDAARDRVGEVRGLNRGLLRASGTGRSRGRSKAKVVKRGAKMCCNGAITLAEHGEACSMTRAAPSPIRT